jgi:hypothetical protein
MKRMAARIGIVCLAVILSTGTLLGGHRLSGSAPASGADWLSSELPDTQAILPALPVKPCRGPEFAGCSSCCEQVPGEPQCVMLTWTGPDEPGLIPWYNSSTWRDGRCPLACHPCASCLTREERDYAELGERPDCDCDSQRIGVDPCFAPKSCACYCMQALRILRDCPHLRH